MSEKVACSGHKDKLNHYKNMLPKGVSPAKVCPITMYVYGGLFSEGLEFIRSVAKYLSPKNNALYSLNIHRIMATMSLNLWKGNSFIVSSHKNRLPRMIA